MTGSGSRLVLLEELFRRHYAELVRGLALVEGPEAAADAVQDAFVQAYRHWRRIARYDDPVAWIRRVAINRLLNQRRGARRKPLTFGLDDLDAAGGQAALSPERDHVEERLDVASAMADLTARQRACLSLYYFGDWPVSAVAEALAVSEGTVKAVLHQARRRMAPALGGEQ